MPLCWRLVRNGNRVGIAGAAFLLLTLLAPPALSRKEYHSEAYHVAVSVEPDGSVAVHEEIRVRFDGGPFTYFYRGIPLSRADGIEGIRATEPTRVRKRENRMEVTWTFPPCRDTTRTFVVDYRARGVLFNEGDHRRLRWPAFPPGERPYRIDAASATIVLPAGTPPPVCATEPTGLAFHPRSRRIEADGMPADSEPSEMELTLEPVRLRANRNVVLRVDFPPGALPGPDPAWRLEQLRWKERRPGVLAAAGVLLALGLGWILRTRSDLMARLAPGTAGARLRGPFPTRSEPPEEVSPALAGALVLGQPAMVHAFAVLFDLSRRGLLTLVPSASGGRWASPKPKVFRGASPGDLEPWERTVYDAAFQQANADGSADWRRVVSRLSRCQPAFSRQVQSGLVQRGAFDPAGLEGRGVLKRRLLMLLVPDVAAVIAGILLLKALGPAAFLPVGAIAVVLVVAAVMTATFPLRTRRGRELAQAWKGFARYLQDAPKSSTPMDAARFAGWLPHAVALGAAMPWVKAGQRAGIEPPSWFRSSSGDLDADMRALRAVLAIAGATAASSGAHGGGGASSGAG